MRVTKRDWFCTMMIFTIFVENDKVLGILHMILSFKLYNERGQNLPFMSFLQVTNVTFKICTLYCDTILQIFNLQEPS